MWPVAGLAVTNVSRILTVKLVQPQMPVQLVISIIPATVITTIQTVLSSIFVPVF